MSDSTRPKVLVISHLYPYRALGLKWGSVGTFVRDQLKALHNFCDLRVLIPVDCMPRRGHYPGWFVRWWAHIYMLPKRFNDDGLKLDVVRFLALPPRSSFLYGYGSAAFLPLLWRARAIRKTFSFDVIHAHTVVPDGIVAIWLGAIFNVPTLITSHQGDVERVPANWLNRATLRYTLSRAGRVIAVSNSLKKAITHLGIEEQKIKVVPNGFDPAKFAAAENKASGDHINQTEKVVLFIGQLVPRKDPLTLIRALAQLKKRLLHVRLVMVGDGFLRNQLDQEVGQLGLSGDIDMAGEVPHSKVPQYIQAADVLCLPSLSEGWPTVIFEALSQGVPVIASCVGGIPEAISSEDYGLLVKPGDLTGLTEALYRGLTITWDHSKIRQYAANFTWQNNAVSLSREYFDLIEERASVDHRISSIAVKSPTEGI